MKLVLDLQDLQEEFPQEFTRRFRRASDIKRFILAARKHDIFVLLNSSTSSKANALRRELVSVLGPDKVRCIPTFPEQKKLADDRARALLRQASEIYRHQIITEIAPDLVDHGPLSGRVNGLPNKKMPTLGGETINVGHWYVKRGREFDLSLNRLDYVITNRHRGHGNLVLEQGFWKPDHIFTIPPTFGEEFERSDIGEFRTDVGAKTLSIFLSDPEPRVIRDFFRSYLRLPVHLQWSHRLAILCRTDRQAEVSRRIAVSFGFEDIVRVGKIGHSSAQLQPSETCLTVYLNSDGDLGYEAAAPLARGIPVLMDKRSYLGGLDPANPIFADPKDHARFAATLEKAVMEPKMRYDLWIHGRGLIDLLEARDYATDLLSRFESICTSFRSETRATATGRNRRLLFFSPLPPAPSGVADYSLDLLVALYPYYDIDCVVDQPEVRLGPLQSIVTIVSSENFDEPIDQYDAIIYNMGNSEHHQYMMSFMDRYPGVTILHDFYLGHLLAWARHKRLLTETKFNNEVYLSHGLPALERLQRESHEQFHKRMPLSGWVFRKSRAVVVHSEYTRRLAADFYFAAPDDVTVIPMIAPVTRSPDRLGCREALGIPDHALVVASFGMLTPFKKCEMLIDAWLRSHAAAEENGYLVFVGEANDAYRGSLESIIRQSPHAGKILVTGRVSDVTYSQYLGAADIVVQLRTDSRGETSKSTIDALALGKPVILNGHGTALEWPEDTVFRISDPITRTELTEAINQLALSHAARASLGTRAGLFIAEHHRPSAVAQQLVGVLASAAASPAAAREVALRDISELVRGPGGAALNCRHEIASSLNFAFARPLQRSVFVDVSVLADFDAHTGIQRVVKSIFHELVLNSPPAVRIEPVVIREGTPRYAQSFIKRYFGDVFDTPFDDAWIKFGKDDHYIALDWVPDRYPEAAGWFDFFRGLGGTVTTVVYDLLPLNRPEFFPSGTYDNFLRWARACVNSSDRIACISKSVAADVKSFIDAEDLPFDKDAVASFPLGSDLRDLPRSAASGRKDVFPSLKPGKTVLMVGTLEPRKGYVQAVNAFDTLWRRNVGVNLVIVGKMGWRCDDIQEAFAATGQLGRRLIWLSDASDRTLSELYQTCDLLLAASHDEGFGLPIIEAARHHVPVIARDTPIFREVCPEGSKFFVGDEPEAISDSITTWLRRAPSRVAPGSLSPTLYTWKDAAQALLSIALRREVRDVENA